MTARRSLTRAGLAAATTFLGMTGVVLGHDVNETVAGTSWPPTLWDNLGSLHYPITTTSEEAQKYFDQGLRLSYAFNHEEARRAFRYARELDPSCALCYWGEALVVGPNINAAMNPAMVESAVDAVAHAAAQANASVKEKALIAALQARYSGAPDADRLALDAAYADAMVALAATYPDDPEINTLAAEALMDTQPWDYWVEDEHGAKVFKGRGGEIDALLKKTMAINPDHPGAIHYYIHLVENSDTPELALEPAERLAALMPGAGHLVHMPSHIYYVIGRFEQSMHDNVAAAKADEAFLDSVKDTGVYGSGYYPHNLHFVLVSAQMAGDGATTIEMANKLASVVTEEAAATTAWVQPIMLAPYWAHAQYSDAETILALPDPGNTFPFVKGMWHYARGVALAARKNFAGAAAQAAAIDELANTGDLSFLINNYIPADQLLQIARHAVLARIAAGKGYMATAIDEWQRAADLQGSLAYMEPPYWYYPVKQSLGAALLNAGRAEEAAATFAQALEESPNNGWVLFGLKAAQEQLGDAAGAKATEAALNKAWIGPADFLDLSKL